MKQEVNRNKFNSF